MSLFVLLILLTVLTPIFVLSSSSHSFFVFVFSISLSASSPPSNITILNQQANNDLLKEQKSLKTQLSDISRSYQETRIKLSEREEACDIMSGG